MAQNFVNPDSIAVIDDLKVEFTLCSCMNPHSINFCCVYVYAVYCNFIVTASTVSQQTVTTLTTVPTLQVISDQECKLDCDFEQG